MTTEALSVTTTVPASAEAVFAVLADPASHAAIDGTGWVCGPLDCERPTTSGQVFRMGMYHVDHPDGRYEIANQVRELDPPRAISWEPGRSAYGGTSETRTAPSGTRNMPKERVSQWGVVI